MSFRDHFSQLAHDYARYRPQYPADLFEYLASLAPARRLAWDCGAGNGQAALQLAQYFDRVYATDASPEQIDHAYQHEKIEYRVEQAERASLASGSVDLVTVAVAVHWFDLDVFYQEVRRVLKPQGILAVWTYHLPRITPAVDQILATYYREVVGDYWPEQFHYVDERYRTLPFPFAELEPPEFKMITRWSLDQLAGFLSSWSATKKYTDQNGAHPVEVIWTELQAAWGQPELQRELHWPLHLRIGRYSKE